MELLNVSTTEFTELLASPAPVPGGGGASALVGAVGIALGDMVGELTVGKKKCSQLIILIYGLVCKQNIRHKKASANTEILPLSGAAICLDIVSDGMGQLMVKN